MISKFRNIKPVLEGFGIDYEHIADEACDDDHYEFIEITNTDLTLNVEEYTDGFYYTIEERGYPPMLGQVSEQCFLEVFIHILKDHFARLNGRL